MSKKGVSAVVVTVMIILLAIIAVGILWVALKPGIESGAEQVGAATECFNLRLKIDSASYNSVAGTTSVGVKREAGQADLSSLKFLVDGSEVTAAETEVPNELETKTYTLTTASKPAKIEVAGVLTGDKLCSVADMVEGGEITGA